MQTKGEKGRTVKKNLKITSIFFDSSDLGRGGNLKWGEKAKSPKREELKGEWKGVIVI